MIRHAVAIPLVFATCILAWAGTARSQSNTPPAPQPLAGAATPTVKGVLRFMGQPLEAFTPVTPEFRLCNEDANVAVSEPIAYQEKKSH